MAERRERRSRNRLKIDKQEVVKRVLDFYERDLTDRDTDYEARLQRYAKFRMWTEGKDWPWEDSSDAAYPDMMEKSLRLQDTLHNAVMATRPPVGATALKKTDKDKVNRIDNLIDYQVFVEQNGEEIVGELCDAFVNDGVFTAYIPWIKEFRETSKVKTFPPIPEELTPFEHFEAILKTELPNENPRPKNDGWDFDLEEGRVSFFTKNNEVEMVTEKQVTVYDGPRILPKEYEDVLHPPRAANLQMPSPSNPGGASHVILRDFPTVDEIKRLKKQGFYDLMTKEEADLLESETPGKTDQNRQLQKDDFAGAVDNPPKIKSHRTLTRLVCFDTMDIDNDGIDEDVIFWVIKETGTLLKAKRLTEMFPANPPRRPFAEAAFLPIRGRRAGISLLEMVEGLHDMMKDLMDQTIDAGTVQNVPFFFYRPSGSMKPEIIRLSPGEGYPLNDPNRDINFPNFQNNSQGFGINMITLLSNMQDRLTLQGDIQSGRVPPGRSAALRTVGGLALLSAQGEARPERILRRFFMGLTQAWRQIHEHNQNFLPKEKQVRISGVSKPSEDPYLTISSRDDISGQFQFDFKANVLNTSKSTLQQSLGAFGQILISQLALQFGIAEADGIYRWMRDSGNALGLDPDRYMSEPRPGSGLPKIFAEEAMTVIIDNGFPQGEAAEAGGAPEHFQKLMELAQTDSFGILNEQQIDVFKAYLQQVQDKARAQLEQQQAAEAARGFGQEGGQPGRPAESVDTGGTPQVSGDNELLDESLPGAGGGQ